MKNFLLFLFVLLFSTSLWAQKETQEVSSSPSDLIHNLLLKDKEYLSKFEENNKAWQEWALKKNHQKVKPSKNTIQSELEVPVQTLQVAFHDMRSTASVGVPASYTTIIDKLNIIFSGGQLSPLERNGNTLTIKPAGLETHIRFCVATHDINNKIAPTTFTVNPAQSNINARYSSNSWTDPLVNIANHPSAPPFPTAKYINVYIVDNIQDATINGVSYENRGFAYMPYAHGKPYDGIYIERRYLELITDGQLNYNMNAFAQLMARYLGLFQVYGICPLTIDDSCSCSNTNCLYNGDMVCDTPPSKRDLTASCNSQIAPNTCLTESIPSITDGTHPVTDIANPTANNDLKTNYMDDGDFHCQYLFTNGQISRMQFMIDPVYGTRKSLLGNAPCASCDIFANCSLSLNNPLEGIVITEGTAPLYNAVLSCSVPVTFNWSLISTDIPSSSIFPEATGNSFSIPSNIVSGNYKLTLRALHNNGCMIENSFNFQVIPVAGNCNLSLPADNLSTSWQAGWKRVVYKKGWSRDLSAAPPYPFKHPATDRQMQTGDATATGEFEIINSASFNDANFSGATFPAALDKVMRIGKKINTTNVLEDGAAAYVSVDFHPTRNNCKYRIYYLGLTNAQSATNIKYFPINGFQSSDATFGFVSQYSFLSPVTGTSTLIGMTEDGFLNTTSTAATSSQYGLNDLVFGKHHSNFSNTAEIIIDNTKYKKMLEWKYYDLDFSEFVDLDTPGQQTKITLTFFARSKDQLTSKSHAYAYFGIQCLGGGVPKPIAFDLPDYSIPCSDSSVNSKIIFDIPKPNYVISDTDNGALLYWYATDNNFALVTRRVSSTDSFTTNLANAGGTARFDNNFYRYTASIDLNPPSNVNPVRFYEFTYKTLHGSIRKVIRVAHNFANVNVPCPVLPTSGLYGGDHTGNSNVYICSQSQPPTLSQGLPCFTPISYRWIIDRPTGTGSNTNLDTNSPQYTIDPSRFTDCVSMVTRYAYYNTPFCGTNESYKGESFYVYNLDLLSPDYETVMTDICANDKVTLSVDNFKINSSCYNTEIFNTPSTNSILFELLAPGGAVLATNTIENYDQIAFSTPTNRMLEFANESNGIFTLSPGNYELTLRITMNLFGCAVVKTKIIPLRIAPSAIAGSIALVSNQCPNIQISSQDPGDSQNGVYQWEYAHSQNGPYLPLNASNPSLPNTADLNYNLSSVGSYPFYIRRKSIRLNSCENDAYTAPVLVNTTLTAQFFLPNMVCEGQTIQLPATSFNNYSGTWSAPVSGINSQGKPTKTFTFIPDNQCISSYIYTVVILPTLPNLFQGFTTSYCIKSPPPLLPHNRIATGNWYYNGQPVSTINTDQAGTFTYNFVGTGTSICVRKTLTITILENTIVPTFDFGSHIDVCYGNTAPILNTISNNNIPGTWSPTTIDNVNPRSYTFTPTDGYCGLPIVVDVSIGNNCFFVLSHDIEVGCGKYIDPFKIEINNGPCLRVCQDSEVTYTIQGTIEVIQNTIWNVTGGQILSSSNSFCKVKWNGTGFSALQGVMHLNDGTQISIDKCIEKMNAPHAYFGVYPNLDAGEYTFCKQTNIQFENLSNASTGDETLFYSWDFGDGTFSSEYEPNHIYNESGSYKVTLKVINGCGCGSIYSKDIHILKEPVIKIACASIACEGSISNYSIDKKISCKDITWTIGGGTLIDISNDKNKIIVQWDNVDDSGFGYISVDLGKCGGCDAGESLKIPIIKNNGKIVGENSICAGSQAKYTLPQWPTTEFNWTILNPELGTLHFNNQRNEVYVTGIQSGILKLRCNYFNTLMGCGGTATLDIDIKSKINLKGQLEVCANTNKTYFFMDDTQSPVNVNYTITGPNGFNLTDFNSSFSISFPSSGIYTIVTQSNNYCSEPFFIKVSGVLSAPTSITGELTVCPGIMEKYTCIAPSGAVTNWEVVNGTIIGASSGNEITVSFNPSATTYAIKAWYNNQNCPSPKFTKTIERSIPNLNLNPYPTTVCANTEATYNLNYNVEAENYLWSVVPSTAGSIISGQNTKIVAVLWNQTSGTVYLKLNARQCGMTHEKTYPIQIQSPPTATIQLLSEPNTSFCSNKQVVFSVALSNGGTINSVEWNFGENENLQTTNSPNVTHTFESGASSEPQTRTVTAMIKGPSTCDIPILAQFNVTVLPMPQILVSPNQNQSLCYENSMYKVIIPDWLSQENPVIKWYHNGNYFANSPEINFRNQGVGTYKVTVEYNGCIATSRTYLVSQCQTQGSCTANYELNPVGQYIGCSRIRISFSETPEGNPTNISWLGLDNTIASNIFHNNFTYEADVNKPGDYFITVIASYSINGNTCYVQKTVKVTVPYKAIVGYNTSCDSTGLKLTALNNSIYAAAEFQNNAIVTFSIDNGPWQASPLFSLSPGTHILKMKTVGIGPECIVQIPVNILSAMPDATFVASSNVCENTPVYFSPLSSVESNIYSWDFGDGATIIQKSTSRTYIGTAPRTVTLTVTNAYGCKSESSMVINDIIEENMSGTLKFTPLKVCEGQSATITYQPLANSAIPETYYWYNSSSIYPFAETTTPSISVQQSGYYYVYTRDNNGCMNFTSEGVSVTHIPMPKAPTISGSASICPGETVHLEVPKDPQLLYEWTLDGMPLPSAPGENFIEAALSAPGLYTFSVTASIDKGNGEYCTSQESTYTVNVKEGAENPIVEVTVVTCSPYLVNLKILNEQVGVNYQWSNGTSGPDIYASHDGPISVTAYSGNGCGVKNSFMLPVDLEAVTWIVPEGCYEFCGEKISSYLVGPLGSYESWQWLSGTSPVKTGNWSVDPLLSLSTGSTYSLNLVSPECNITAGALSIEHNKKCKDCEFGFDLKDIIPLTDKVNCFYRVAFNIQNPTGTPIWLTLTAEDGYFLNNTIEAQMGGNTFSMLFFPTNGFAGGSTDIFINGISTKTGACFTKFKITLPPLCENASEYFPDKPKQLPKQVTVEAIPNPVVDFTYVNYQFSNEGLSKSFYLTDMLGRILWSDVFTDEKGAFNLNLNPYSAGHYILFMKEDGKIAKQIKLIRK